jgi:hypothetical protein
MLRSSNKKLEKKNNNIKITLAKCKKLKIWRSNVKSNLKE